MPPSTSAWRACWLLGQGRLADAEPWLERAGRTVRTEAEPAAAMNLYYASSVLAMARGRHQKALADIQAAERLAGTLVTPPTTAALMRAHMLQTHMGLGQTERVEAGLDEHERGSAEMRTALAAVRLAQNGPRPAAAVLAPVLDGSVPEAHAVYMVRALLLEAIARDALGDPAATGRALERTLDLAEAHWALIPFLLDPAPGTARAPRPATYRACRPDSRHLEPARGDEPAGCRPPAAPAGQPGSLREPLTQAETRVLRYLPTHLTGPEIAGQLYLPMNTVWTHTRAKLGVHRATRPSSGPAPSACLHPPPEGPKCPGT